jgi:hypothetical protein
MLQRQLTALVADIQVQRTKKAQYEHLQKLLRPLKNPITNVQPNLVTRDGELAKELGRMRVLMARVSSKMETLVSGETGDPMELEEDADERLEKVLRL